MRVPLLVSAVALTFVVAVPTYAQKGGGMMGGPMARHRMAMHGGLPAEYAAKKNPLKASADIIAAGKALFTQNCVVCHGAKGAGDGEGGKALNPPPGDLRGLSGMPMASDAFYYWTLADGGAPLKSAMPPYKSVLKEDDIWKLVHYLRTL